ncbi:MAG TPA: cell division protein FtsQ/DivIB, partial [Burkholderiaceae bacterium]|nr:cell division protein FtsQ/DivIB [Burkholderiaceae bacterium]
VRRTWPDRLIVTLTEHRALGVWEDGRLLSDRGELFVANPDEAEIYGALPEFSGPAHAAKDAARRYYEFSAQLATLSLRIDAIDISDRKAWSLRVSSETSDASPSRIELGRDGTAAPLGGRVAQLIAAYPQIAAQVGSPPARIDARYANGLAASLPAKGPATKTSRP